MKKALVGFYLVFLVSFQVVAQKDVDPLQAAIAAKNLTLLKEVIANGGKVNQTFEGYYQKQGVGNFAFSKCTPLVYAMHFDWYEGVLELLRAGAKPNVSFKGTTSGFYAAGCYVSDVDGITPLMIAAIAANVDIIKVLIIAGAETRGSMNVNFSQKCKYTSNTKNTMWHLRQEAPDSVKELLKEGKSAPWAANGLPAEGQRPL